MRRCLTVPELVERWMAKTVEIGECVEWRGAFACAGVTPVVKTRHGGKGHTVNVAVCRVLWEREHGPIPAGKLVYRTCCNNKCVAEKHLAVGTRKQWLAHRKKNGMTNHSAATRLKMTVSARSRHNTVNDIERARLVRSLMGTMSQEEIARVTGVSRAMVSEICCGNAWKEQIGNPFAGLFTSFASNDSNRRAA
jgi:hypothetical protein